MAIDPHLKRGHPTSNNPAAPQKVDRGDPNVRWDFLFPSKQARPNFAPINRLAATTNSEASIRPRASGSTPRASVSATEQQQNSPYLLGNLFLVCIEAGNDPLDAAQESLARIDESLQELDRTVRWIERGMIRTWAHRRMSFVSIKRSATRGVVSHLTISFKLSLAGLSPKQRPPSRQRHPFPQHLADLPGSGVRRDHKQAFQVQIMIAYRLT